jgi:hypothetical protein
MSNDVLVDYLTKSPMFSATGTITPDDGPLVDAWIRRYPDLRRHRKVRSAPGGPRRNVLLRPDVRGDEEAVARRQVESATLP